MSKVSAFSINYASLIGSWRQNSFTGGADKSDSLPLDPLMWLSSAIFQEAKSSHEWARNQNSRLQSLTFIQNCFLAVTHYKVTVYKSKFKLPWTWADLSCFRYFNVRFFKWIVRVCQPLKTLGDHLSRVPCLKEGTSSCFFLFILYTDDIRLLIISLRRSDPVNSYILSSPELAPGIVSVFDDSTIYSLLFLY